MGFSKIVASLDSTLCIVRKYFKIKCNEQAHQPINQSLLLFPSASEWRLPASPWWLRIPPAQGNILESNKEKDV